MLLTDADRRGRTSDERRAHDHGAVTPTGDVPGAGPRHRVIPVTRRLLADGETPVGVYRKLAGGPGSFLLESAEQGVHSAARLVALLVHRRTQRAPR